MINGSKKEKLMQDQRETKSPDAEGRKAMSFKIADYNQLMAIYRRGDNKYRDALRELAQR
jgi:hypothetical protein